MMSEIPQPKTQDPPVLSETDARGVGTVTLNRPGVNNAYDADMIEGLLDAIGRLGADPAVRVIVIRGNGRLLQAGADLNWLAQVSEAGEEENLEVSRKTTDAVRFLDTCPKPTLALVHGGCFGGGIGILAACDVVIASEEALFSISEVRWGLIPGPIVPQLAAKIGVGQLRRYALTGERFAAAEAKRIGLVSETCDTGALDQTAAPIIESLLRNGPQARRPSPIPPARPSTMNSRRPWPGPMRPSGRREKRRRDWPVSANGARRTGIRNHRPMAERTPEWSSSPAPSSATRPRNGSGRVGCRASRGRRSWLTSSTPARSSSIPTGSI